MAPAPGIWAPITMKAFKHAFTKTSNLLKIRLAKIKLPFDAKLQPVYVRASHHHPIHPAAVRQRGARWYTTHRSINATVRRFMSTGPTGNFNRASLPKSKTATAVSRLTARAPFASTLRPNLTGGAMPRTAGGYSLGGGRTNGARYFSHTPAAPAEIINNVSAGVRAFWLSGQKAQFDGVNSAGEKKYRNVTNLQEEAGRKMQSVSRNAPGSFIDFKLNPTITALTPLGASFPFGTSMQQSAPSLTTEGFLEVLSVDFSRALKDLAAIMNDLKRLSSLGNLPITLEQKSILRVRFPGCDSGTVERLCDEVGVQRGIIYQDEDFDSSAGTRMALLFPFASTSEHCPSSPGGSLRSRTGHSYEQVEEEYEENPWADGYESMEEYSDGESAYYRHPSDPHSSSDYEGLEGIYRFIEQCDNSRRVAT